MKRDFRSIDPKEAQIVLVEGTDRVLPPYPPELSAKAEKVLANLGVTVRKETMVTNIEGHTLTVTSNGEEKRISAHTVLWAAGVKASAMGEVLAKETGAELDRAGRIVVEPDLTVPGHKEIFVIGDLATFVHQGDSPLPGVAPVAIQQGRYVADGIKRRIDGRRTKPFRYRDKGNLAVIGRHAAVAHFAQRRFNGYTAWLAWVFVHIWYLIEFDNKFIVMIQWAFDYFTRKRGARLITGDDPRPVLGNPSSGRTLEDERSK
jgi:NADH dehydrogenase